MHAWAKQRHIHLDFIQPGKPQQHASVERYDRTVRFDWRSPWRFDRIADVQESATRWRWTYNNARPNMALGGITPIMKLARAAQLHLRHQLKKGGLPSLEVRADTLVGGLRCTWSSTFYRTDGICTIGFTTEMSTGARGFVSVSGAGERY